MPSPVLDDLLKAPDHQVRAILRALCQEHDTRSRALNYLKDLQAIDVSSSTRKRKAEDELCICVQCDEAFYKNDNTDKTACCYHWGYLELNYDAGIWADDDEMRFGNVDTEANRKEYPEGFMFTCCDKPGDESGCKVGKHEADPAKSRREASAEPSDIDVDDLDEEDDDDDEEDED